MGKMKKEEFNLMPLPDQVYFLYDKICSIEEKLNNLAIPKCNCQGWRSLYREGNSYSWHCPFHGPQSIG